MMKREHGRSVRTRATPRHAIFLLLNPKNTKDLQSLSPYLFLLVWTDRARAVQVSATELGLVGISGTLWRAETSPAAQDAVDDK